MSRLKQFFAHLSYTTNFFSCSPVSVGKWWNTEILKLEPPSLPKAHFISINLGQPCLSSVTVIFKSESNSTFCETNFNEVQVFVGGGLLLQLPELLAASRMSLLTECLLSVILMRKATLFCKLHGRARST